MNSMGARRAVLALPFKGRVGWGWCSFRHSGGGRNPVFALAFSASTTTDSRPCAFVPHPCGPVSFSCLSKRKKPKRRTPSRPRSRAHPARATARARSGVCRQRIPALTANSARSIAPTLRAFSPRTRRGQEGTWKSQSAAFLAAEAGRPDARTRDRLAGRSAIVRPTRLSTPVSASTSARRSALLLNGSPLAPVNGGRQGPQGRAHDARAFAVGTWNVPSANPGRRSRTHRAGCPVGGAVGAPFLLVPFLWASKEKEPARRDAGRTRRDASRFSRKRRKPKQRPKLDSGFRRNDDMGDLRNNAKTKARSSAKCAERTTP